jgi:hypothetical protein
LDARKTAVNGNPIGKCEADLAWKESYSQVIHTLVVVLSASGRTVETPATSAQEKTSSPAGENFSF